MTKLLFKRVQIIFSLICIVFSWRLEKYKILQLVSELTCVPLERQKNWYTLSKKIIKLWKKTCFITNELTINCKLKFLPASIWLNKAYWGTTYISVSLQFLLSFLFLTQKCKQTREFKVNFCQMWAELMYNLESSSQNKQNLSESTTLEGYLERCNWTVSNMAVNWYTACLQLFFRIIPFYASFLYQ